MVYLDYSATTKPLDEVIDTFVKVSKDFPGNPNSLHKLGVESNKLILSATKKIANLLKVKEEEIIYTSGASESNNLAIKGIADSYKNRGKHIITTELEHSSIYGPINYLVNNGFDVDFVSLDENGLVDINHLKKLIRKDTILVSISAVNSEIGIRQNVEEIALLLKEYPNTFFHVDATQCIGKDKIDLTNIDLISFTAHKFYGIKGIGVLIKKENVRLEPIIHGGKSTTKYRSGTPAPALIASLAKALRLALINLDEKYDKVLKINNILQKELSKYEDVSINHNNYCLPHMLNVSVIGIKPETFLHALEEYDIYISTQSACSNGGISKAVYSFTKDEKKALSSIRISLSAFTTEEEINKFLEGFSLCYKKLHLK